MKATIIATKCLFGSFDDEIFDTSFPRSPPLLNTEWLAFNRVPYIKSYSTQEVGNYDRIHFFSS